MEVIIFGDIEDALRVYLTAEFTTRAETATVACSVPNPRSERFVTVQRLGGPREGLVMEKALVALEAWADTPSEAAALCQLARALVFRLEGQVISTITVHRVSEVGGPAPLPDPISDQARYVCTIELQCRGQPE